MLHTVVIEALLTGLSMGMVCCLSCYPFLVPVFASEERTACATGRVWLQVLGGRLVGYVVFGALIGWLGQRFGGPGLLLLSTFAMMAMAAILVSYAIGFWRPAWSLCPLGTRRGAATPALLGFLLGAHACPPFLLSAAYVFTLQSTAKGIVYFLVFFCTTSLFFLPLLGVGLLGRLRELRLAARASAGLVGCLFLIYGAVMVQRLVMEFMAP